MKKKLYKAKKNWVIGFIAGTMLIVSGVNIHDVYADTQPTYNTVKVENDYTKTQLAVTASSGISIPQNNTIRQDYSDLRNFSTPMKTVEDTDGIQKYLTYNANTDTSSTKAEKANYQAAAKVSQEEEAKSNKYLQDGVFTDHSKKYKDYTKEHTLYDDDNGHFKKIFVVHSDKPNQLDIIQHIVYTKDGLADKYAPKVTYNREGYTSFIQFLVLGHAWDWYSFDYFDSIRGFTFKDGRQLPISYFVDMDKLQTFIRQVEKRYQFYGGANTDKYQKGKYNYFLTDSGVNVILGSGGVSGYNSPISVLLPLSLIKDNLRSLFSKTLTVDVQKQDNDFIAGKLGDEAKDEEKEDLLDKLTNSFDSYTKAHPFNFKDMALLSHTDIIQAVTEYGKPLVSTVTSKFIGVYSYYDTADDFIDSVFGAAKNRSEAKAEINNAKVSEKAKQRIKDFKDAREHQLESMSWLDAVKDAITGAFDFSGNPMLATACSLLSAILIGYIVVGLWHINFLGMKEMIEQAFNIRTK